MQNRLITKSIPHIEHTTCSWCEVEHTFVGERYVDAGYAVVYCPSCRQDFDVQIPAWWIEEK